MVSEQLLGLILSAAIGIVGILATLAGVVLTNRSAQKLLTIQLQHEENKKAIRDLNSLLISTPPATTASVYYDEFRGFLQSIDSAYLPDAVREWATRKLGDHKVKLDEYLARSGPSDPRLKGQFQDDMSDFADEATSYLMSSLAGRPYRRGHRIVMIRSLFRKTLKWRNV